MRLVFATIVAAATLTALSTPAMADGERGRDDNRSHHEERYSGRHGDRDDRRFERHDNRHQQYRDYGRRDYRHFDNRGSRYWGPSARPWSHWDNRWGDPHRYARQWGFDRYDYNRGWQRGNTWYSSPNQWSDWGGWNWSFSVGNGSFNNGNYYQQPANCALYRTQDWINGRRAIVTYTGCADRWGQVFEQPGTRRVERWGW
jgi:hypothetical protein